jgi:hypothetical protein
MFYVDKSFSDDLLAFGNIVKSDDIPNTKFRIKLKGLSVNLF